MLCMCIHSYAHVNGAKLVDKRDVQLNTEESP